MPLPQIQIIPLNGFAGYSGVKARDFTLGFDNPADWNGFYISQEPNEAAGYTYPDSGPAEGSLWGMSFSKETQVVRVLWGANGAPDSATQATLIRGALKKRGIVLGPKEDLIEGLGKRGYAYMGPGAESGQELVMSRSLAGGCLTLPPRLVARVQFDAQIRPTWSDPNCKSLGRRTQCPEFPEQPPRAGWPEDGTNRPLQLSESPQSALSNTSSIVASCREPLGSSQRR
jgi:hypothetical protein